jgi:alpha-glucosidase
MQWDASPFAGFSTHAPWLPLTPDYETRNVEVMRHDATSILSLVRSLLHYRRRSAALKEGEWSLLSQDSSILAYKRGWGEYSIIVVLNFSGLPRIWSNPAGGEPRIAISTHGDRRAEAVGTTVPLRANEGLMMETARASNDVTPNKPTDPASS